MMVQDMSSFSFRAGWHRVAGLFSLAIQLLKELKAYAAELRELDAEAPIEDC